MSPLHKFGGPTLQDAAHYRHAVRLLDTDPPVRFVVVSAMGGVTAALQAAIDAATAGADWRPGWQTLCMRHVDAASELDPEDRHGSAHWFRQQFAACADALQALATSTTTSPAARAAVLGLGEVWSARLMQMALGDVDAGWQLLDAREVLRMDADGGRPVMDWPASRMHLAQWLQDHRHDRLVITGFIARDAHGEVVTLGRNGSDWSASLFAVLLQADALTIWTDVDGLTSADPALVPDAFVLPELSHAEAAELATFGSRLLHPQTLAPAQEAGLPVHIRNAFHPAAPGTRVHAQARSRSPVKGLTVIQDMALLDFSGPGMLGVPGMAARFFAALGRAGVSVSMTAEGSSEHAMCSVIRADQGEVAQRAVQAEFADALASGSVSSVTLTPDISILAAVGDGMVGTQGVSARLFHGLSQARVNVRAIAQDASERNISVAIASGDTVRALRAVHGAFWLSPATVSMGLIGPGNVGRALLEQFARTLPDLAADPHSKRRLDLRLRAVANSRRMQLQTRRIDPEQALAGLQDAEPFDLDAFVAHVRADHLPHALIIDCSGSDAIAEHYADWLAAGIHVVTPAKHAGSGPLARYRAIRAAERHGGQFRYEATVGAGLPVIQTLRSLLDTGDVLTAIDGMLSGTLAWLFNRFDGSVPFSQLVLEARALGYTEPDPRDDLSGMDVARKLVILAREAGRELSLDEVQIESLVPEPLRGLEPDVFLQHIVELDAPMRQRLDAARARGRSLRYLATLDAGGNAHVGLAMPDPDHASLHSRLTDNLIQFRTRRYADNPLVVQGPGAGAEVTAAGVFSDVLAIARTLGGHA